MPVAVIPLVTVPVRAASVVDPVRRWLHEHRAWLHVDRRRLDVNRSRLVDDARGRCVDRCRLHINPRHMYADGKGDVVACVCASGHTQYNEHRGSSSCQTPGQVERSHVKAPWVGRPSWCYRATERCLNENDSLRVSACLWVATDGCFASTTIWTACKSPSMTRMPRCTGREPCCLSDQLVTKRCNCQGSNRRSSNKQSGEM